MRHAGKPWWAAGCGIRTYLRRKFDKVALDAGALEHVHLRAGADAVNAVAKLVWEIKEEPARG